MVVLNPNQSLKNLPCGTCPPERICAWACQQGMNTNDILTEILLINEKTEAKHLENTHKATVQAIWEKYNYP